MLEILSKYNFYQKLRFILIAFGIVHAIYCAIFLFLGHSYLALMNVFSVSMYFFLAVKLKNIRSAVISFWAIRIEVFLHAFICALTLGWDYGFQNIVLAFMSIVFFASLSNRTVNYLFSAIQGAAYIFLYFYFKDSPIVATVESEFMYLFNFFLIMSVIMIMTFDVIKSFSGQIQAEMLRKQEILSKIANKDSLTGLLNRNAFYTEVLKNLLETEQNISVAICDIDDFKKVNDTYGHGFGDEVLKRIAAVFKKSLRNNDYVFRWGGEEFVIVLTSINLDASNKIFNRIREIIASTDFIFENKKVKVTMTFGAVNLKVHSKTDIDSVIKQADALLYQGKKSGKNKVVSSKITVSS